MKTQTTAKAGAKRRSLFAELAEGFDALAEQRAGKQTLRTEAVESRPTPAPTPRRSR